MTPTLLSRLIAAIAAGCVTFSLLIGVTGLADPQLAAGAAQLAKLPQPMPALTAHTPA